MKSDVILFTKNSLDFNRVKAQCDHHKFRIQLETEDINMESIKNIINSLSYNKKLIIF